MKYVALLRGINVGGKNSVKMAELKECFESLGFTNVLTYINSGNVLFETDRRSDSTFVEQCLDAFEKRFGFRVPLAVISAKELKDALDNAPNWWDKNSADKNNAIFVIAPATPKDVMTAVGDAKPEYERVAAHGPIIFWTAPFKTFSRTRYSGIVGSTVYKDTTIRNSRTTRKLLNLLYQ